MRVWVDTDVGDNPDDLVALLVAVAHPEADLVGVSTVSGDVEARADLVRSFVPDGVVVVAGDRELVATVDDVDPEALVAIGPLTNVARLADGGVKLPERLVVMGGALEPVVHRGATRDVESNFGLDPAASRLVLDWTDAVIVPLDVTADIRVARDEADALGRAHPPLGDQLAEWAHELVLHDPLALLVALEAVEVTVERLPISADRDGRVVQRRGAREHDVVVRADVDAARRRVLELLGE